MIGYEMSICKTNGVRRTFSDFKYLFTVLYGLFRSFDDSPRWIEVFEKVGVGFRNRVCVKILNTCAVEQRLFSTMHSGVV